LHHFCFGIFEKKGRSQAEDAVEHLNRIWGSFDLDISNLICLVSDTEATMISAGRLIVSQSLDSGGEAYWHGCIDHLLELVTKVAFTDTEDSEDTMKCARDLVAYSNSSSQAEQRLLSLQVGTSVKCIQDVSTRWWSTFSMCERLLRLKMYFSVMEVENGLKSNLTGVQWEVISDTCSILAPFMFAQRLLEGESYVTNSMVPYILYKVKKGLVQVLESASSTPHVRSLARKMCNIF
jgi:hypothetical protein